MYGPPLSALEAHDLQFPDAFQVLFIAYANSNQLLTSEDKSNLMNELRRKMTGISEQSNQKGVLVYRDDMLKEFRKRINGVVRSFPTVDWD